MRMVRDAQSSEPEARLRVCYDGRPGEQRFGTGETVDREEVFADRLAKRRSPSSLAQAKLVHAFGAGRGLPTCAFDIKGAFLTTSFGEEEIHYVVLAPELEAAVLRVMGWERPAGGKLCFRLRGGLYGLIAAGEMWSEDFGECIGEIG